MQILHGSYSNSAIVLVGGKGRLGRGFEFGLSSHPSRKARVNLEIAHSGKPGAPPPGTAGQQCPAFFIFQAPLCDNARFRGCDAAP